MADIVNIHTNIPEKIMRKLNIRNSRNFENNDNFLITPRTLYYIYVYTLTFMYIHIIYRVSHKGQISSFTCGSFRIYFHFYFIKMSSYANLH